MASQHNSCPLHITHASVAVDVESIVEVVLDVEPISAVVVELVSEPPFPPFPPEPVDSEQDSLSCSEITEPQLMEIKDIIRQAKKAINLFIVFSFTICVDIY